jgi:RNA polymerase sigma-70 factor (ECF subfamily)
MSTSSDLTTIFLASAPAEVQAALNGDLEPALSEVVAAAKLAWPSLDLPLETFFAFVAERLPMDAVKADPAAALRATRAADLYLAAACASGDERAIAAFGERYGHVVDGVVARRSDRERLADDVRQALFERLFVRKDAGNDDDAGPPKIVEYRGRGDLAGFLRVAAARAMLNVLRGDKRRSAAHEAHGRAPVHIVDPELERIELHHREDFRAALRDAAAELTPRERNLLSQHHIDGLTMDQLAKLYGLHRVTIIRAIGAAREKLANGTRKRLRERLRIDQAELDSLLRVVGSKLELSIQRYLRSAG